MRCPIRPMDGAVVALAGVAGCGTAAAAAETVAMGAMLRRSSRYVGVAGIVGTDAAAVAAAAVSGSARDVGVAVRRNGADSSAPATPNSAKLNLPSPSTSARTKISESGTVGVADDMAEPCETVLRNEELLYSHTEPTAATKMRRASMRRAMMSTPLASRDVWLRCRGDVKKEFFPPPHEAEDTGLGLTPV